MTRYTCTFCLKNDLEIIAMIYLNDNVNICNECVDICDSIILEYRKNKSNFRLLEKTEDANKS